jgi:aspartyl-tRNA(Asn)/glutamyl-tRNA(Gln) amidotransferase subunit A
MEHQAERVIPEGIRALGAAYRSGGVTPTEATSEYLRRVQALNPRLNCFITVLRDQALKSASDSDQRFRAGTPIGPLDGIPLAVKDLVYIEGVRCTAGSKILEKNIAAYDAPVVGRLKSAGAVLLGTTNLHEFAAGVTSDNPHFGPVRNPWDEARTPGGSSGGSGAAVAARLSAAAIGTDTGGSVRIPGALCGVVGFKPSYGRVSRLGVVPLAPSFDTVGFLTLSAWDAAALLNATAGHLNEDMTTADVEVVDYVAALSEPLRQPRIGVIRNFFFDTIDPEVESNFEAFVSRLRELGCTSADVDLDWVPGSFERWLPIREVEAMAFHLRWLESTPELYGDDVRELLEEGKSVSGVEYVTAVNARPSFMEKFADTMRGYDLLVAPCTSVPATKLGQKTVEARGKTVSVRSALIKPSIPFNYIGCPVVSVPTGFVRGLPVGSQVVGRLFDEGTLLRLVDSCEKKFGPHGSPPLRQTPATA